MARVRRRIRWMLLGAAIAAIAIFGAPNAQGQNEGEAAGNLRGQNAVDAWGPDIAIAAEQNRMSSVELINVLLNDRSTRLSPDGRLVYVDPVAPDLPFVRQAPTGIAPRSTPADVFDLESLPGSSHTLYLDFDGHFTEGVPGGWNGGVSFDSPAYDLDGDPDTFSQAELDDIFNTWQVVVEDFAPFDVNVTTKDPGLAALTNSNGLRIVFTEDTQDVPCGCGGQAYYLSFLADFDLPAFTYNSSWQYAGDTASHEAGHAFGLRHDGDLSEPAGTVEREYYFGHESDGAPSWGPIMGVSWTRVLGQWSEGGYGFASNTTDDDLAELDFFLGYRDDDHGDAADPTIQTDSTFAIEGLIETTSDKDAFEFTTAMARSFQITAYSPAFLSNLDIKLTLRDAAGDVVVRSSPALSIAASVTVALDAGTYTLEIDGTGTGDPFGSPRTGYSDYGSLGSYAIAVVASDPLPECEGRVVTIDMTQGASGIGTSADDVVLGTGGDDYIETKGGDDVICAGAGDGRVKAGSGDDLVYGEDGDDTIWGQNGEDLLEGGPGKDTIRGGTARDEIVGGNGDDRLYGNAGDDLIHGESGDDYLNGSGGDDELWGGLGDDELLGKRQDDMLFGGADDDELIGGSSDDELYGGDGEDNLQGQAGNDTLAGGNGPDALSGGPNTDTCSGNAGTDTADNTCETIKSTP